MNRATLDRPAVPSVPYGRRLEGDVVRPRPVVLPGWPSNRPPHVSRDGPALDVRARTALLAMPS